MTPEQIIETTSKINRSLNEGKIPNAIDIAPMGAQIAEVGRLIEDIQKQRSQAQTADLEPEESELAPHIRILETANKELMEGISADIELNLNLPQIPIDVSEEKKFE